MEIKEVIISDMINLTNINQDKFLITYTYYIKVMEFKFNIRTKLFL